MERTPYRLPQQSGWQEKTGTLVELFCRADPWQLDEPAADWMDRLERDHWEPLRTLDEYRLELLLCGVLLLCCAGQLTGTARLVSPLLSRLYSLRNSHPRWKKSADRLRGQLLRCFKIHQPSVKAGKRTRGVARLLNLEKKLAAIGDYDEELARLRLWRSSLQQVPGQYAEQTVRNIERSARLFLTDAHNRLAPFVDPQAPRELAAARRGREDYLLAARPVPLYYLNLFAAVLLNRIGRERFNRATRKTVVLPGCLRIVNQPGPVAAAGSCRAVRSSAGLLCSGCTEQCAVNRLTRFARRHGAETVVVEHGSQALEKNRSGRCIPPGTGIIGVACAANLLAGGLKARRLGLPAQCVVLYRPGCRHWQQQPAATCLDEEELKRILCGQPATWQRTEILQAVAVLHRLLPVALH